MKALKKKIYIYIYIYSHASSSHNHESFGEESLRINEYYQPPPRITRRERKEQESTKRLG